MNKKSLIKSISLATVALALSVSYSSLVKADTVEGETLLASPENKITSELWGQLSEDFGVCQVAQTTSAGGEKAIEKKNTNADSKLASPKNLENQTSANICK